MRRRLALALALGVLGCAAAAQPAAATTFCIAKQACVDAGGTAKTDLPSALSAAASNPGRDRIEIGAATVPYASAATDAAGNAVDIVGAGRHDTTLQATGTLLTMQEPTSVLSDVRVVASGSVALVTDLAAGTFQRVDVDGTAIDPSVSSTAIRMRGQGAVLSDSAIAMGTGPAQVQPDYAVRSDATAAQTAPVVRNLVATALVGAAQTADGSLSLAACDLQGRTAAIQTTAGSVTVDDSVLRAAAGPATGIAATVASGASAGAQVLARQVTVLLSGGATGLSASSATSGHPATISADDVVARGTGIAASASTTSGASASVTLDYSSYAFANVTTSGSGSVSGGAAHHDLNDPVPGFVDESKGDARLSASSPLIDAGDPTLATGPTTDLAGLPRTRDGRGTGIAIRDIGAYEYQRLPPTISATATPQAVGTDQEVAYSAVAGDGDAGEVPAVTWAFDDGATATGVETSHTFATAGSHTATATATDPTGQTATTTVTVTVTDTATPRTGPRIFVRVLRRRLDKHRTILIGVFCPADQRPRCVGTVTLSLGSKRVASSSLRVSAGGTQLVKLRVSKQTANLAHRRRGLAVVAKIVARVTPDVATTRSVHLTMRPLR